MGFKLTRNSSYPYSDKAGSVYLSYTYCLIGTRVSITINKSGVNHKTKKNWHKQSFEILANRKKVPESGDNVALNSHVYTYHIPIVWFCCKADDTWWNVLFHQMSAVLFQSSGRWSKYVQRHFNPSKPVVACGPAGHVHCWRSQDPFQNRWV